MPAKARTTVVECGEENEHLPLDEFVCEVSDPTHKNQIPHLHPASWSGYPKRKPRRFPEGKYRGFVFTCFKTCWDTEEMKQWTSVVFASVGLEKAPKSGRMHLQGCVYFKNPRVCSGVDKLLPPNTWFKPARGDECSNDKYTSKERRILLIGKPMAQGERVDLEAIRDRIINGGTTPNELACETGIGYDDLKFAETIFRLAGNAPKREWKTSVIWLYGAAGRGKSHIAKALIGDDDCWKSSAKLDYWQGYQGQETVWLDEFRGDKCTFTALLEILDSTPYEVNVKYGSHQLLARRLVVTSPMHPEKIYPSCAENVNQLLRRIEILWDIDELYAAAASGHVFPPVNEFPKFANVIERCSASRLIAENPIRYEGTKRLVLIDNCWVPKVIEDAKHLSVPGTPVVRSNSRRGRAPTTVDSSSGTEVGGNIASCPDVASSIGEAAPTSEPLAVDDDMHVESKCWYPHADDSICEGCCPHEATAHDEAGNEICLCCEACIIDEEAMLQCGGCGACEGCCNEGDDIEDQEDSAEYFDWNQVEVHDRRQ